MTNNEKYQPHPPLKVFEILVRSEEVHLLNFAWGDFFMRWWKPEEFWPFKHFSNFSKLKTAFCEY